MRKLDFHRLIDLLANGWLAGSKTSVKAMAYSLLIEIGSPRLLLDHSRGFSEARGNALVCVDADLGHPPRFLPRIYLAQSLEFALVWTRETQPNQTSSDHLALGGLETNGPVCARGRFPLTAHSRDVQMKSKDFHFGMSDLLQGSPVWREFVARGRIGTTAKKDTWSPRHLLL